MSLKWMPWLTADVKKQQWMSVINIIAKRQTKPDMQTERKKEEKKCWKLKQKTIGNVLRKLFMLATLFNISFPLLLFGLTVCLCALLWESAVVTTIKTSGLGSRRSAVVCPSSNRADHLSRFVLLNIHFPYRSDGMQVLKPSLLHNVYWVHPRRAFKHKHIYHV